MTFRTIKLPANQEGVTLLLAILLLSAILAISFSLATILLFQVRTSEDFSRTEGALYAADGVGEQALFNVGRQVASPSYVSSFNNNAALSSQPVNSSTTTPVFQDNIAANSTFATTKNKYDFCSDAATTTGCGYGKITLTYLSTGNHNPLLVYLCQFNPSTNYGEAPCTSTTTNAISQYWITNSNLSGGGALPDSPSDPNGIAMAYNGVPLTWTLNSSLQQQLILYDPVSDGNPIYVSIQTYASDGVTPKGIPLSGKTAVNINVLNATTGRKIQVLVPNTISGVTAQAPSNPPQTPWRTASNNALNGPNATDYNMGYRFTPNKNGTITQLAIRTSDIVAHTVRLYDMGGTVLASASVTGNYNNWVVANITPVSVISGTSYVVAVRIGGSGDYYYESIGTPITTGDITVNETRYIAASDALPNSVENAHMYGEADVTFVPN